MMNNEEINYWNNYYIKNEAPINSSEFAKFSYKYLKSGQTILDLGCGNGRDSLFFALNGMKVTSIDQSDFGLATLKKLGKINNVNIDINKGDFVRSNVLVNKKYDNIYSRFTIHSITKDQEAILIKNVYNSLNENGKFFIEVRSTKDEIFGKGKEISYNTYFYNGHLRRFIVYNEIINSLKSVGFFIQYSNEKNGFAKYKNEDPVCIRIIAQK